MAEGIQKARNDFRKIANVVLQAIWTGRTNMIAESVQGKYPVGNSVENATIAMSAVITMRDRAFAPSDRNQVTDSIS